MSEPRECAHSKCTGTVKADSKSEFCVVCDNSIKLAAAGMLTKISHHLELEAQFVAWCLANGQPHPHEDVRSADHD